MTFMKKTLILLAAATAFSCSDKQAQQQNSVENKPVAVQQEQGSFDAKVFEKIQSFYDKHIFGNEFPNDSVIAQYCTKALAKELRDAYDKEFSDGGGYAVWKFRSGAQDGEDIQEIEKIEALGDNKYFVHYNDLGNKGTRTITIVVDGEKILFDKLQ